MTDRELLQLAAKAAGIELWHEDVFTNGLTQKVNTNGVLCWNPLRSDGDALRLAVKLGIDVFQCKGANSTMVFAFSEGRRCSAEVEWDADPNAATRRAITRTAAEMEKEKIE